MRLSIAVFLSREESFIFFFFFFFFCISSGSAMAVCFTSDEHSNRVSRICMSTLAVGSSLFLFFFYDCLDLS